MPNRYRKHTLLLSALLVGATAGGFSGCSEPVPEPPAALRPVRYQVVQTVPRDLATTLVGIARAEVESRLSFRAAGTVEEVDVRVGQVVRRGQSLARLDATDYELQVQEAQAARAQAAAALRQAGSDYERSRALYENRNASKSDLDAARAAAESAQAQVDAADKRIEQAERQLSFTTLRSPTAGTIARVDIEVNETVGSGEPVFLLSAGSSPKVEAAVPESLIGSIVEGQRVEVTLDSLPGRSFEGEVSEVGVAVTEASTYLVSVRLLGDTSKVRSGMAADARFELNLSHQSRDGIFLRPVAVGEDQNGRYVFVIDPESGEDSSPRTGTAQRRAVVIGPMTPQGIEVVEGLVDGDLVATAGVRRLVEGMQVLLLAPESAE